MKNINEFLSSLVGVAAATTFALAGFGGGIGATYADWRVNATNPVGIIHTGNLNLTVADNLTWDNTVIDVTAGAVVTGQATLSAQLTGESLTASISGRLAGAAIDSSIADFVSISVDVEAPDTLSASALIPVTVRLEIKPGLADTCLETLNGLFNLGQLTVNLAQPGGGWSDSVTLNLDANLPALTVTPSTGLDDGENHGLGETPAEVMPLPLPLALEPIAVGPIAIDPIAIAAVA